MLAYKFQISPKSKGFGLFYMGDNFRVLNKNYFYFFL